MTMKPLGSITYKTDVEVPGIGPIYVTSDGTEIPATYPTKTKTALFECDICGAVVSDVEKHERFHAG